MTFSQISAFVGWPDRTDNTTVHGGAVYVFQKTATSTEFLQVQVLELDASVRLDGDYFGTSLSITSDGQFLAVGVPQIYSGAGDLQPGKVLLLNNSHS